MGAFQFVAGWWERQSAWRAVGGVTPPTISLAVRQIEMHPFLIKNFFFHKLSSNSITFSFLRIKYPNLSLLTPSLSW